MWPRCRRKFSAQVTDASAAVRQALHFARAFPKESYYGVRGEGRVGEKEWEREKDRRERRGRGDRREERSEPGKRMKRDESGEGRGERGEWAERGES